MTMTTPPAVPALRSSRPPAPASWRERWDQREREPRAKVLGVAGAIGLAVAALVAGVGIGHSAEPVRYLVLGLGSGALVAALGLGLVLTYTGSGVVNVANGVVALSVGYVYQGLRTEGRLYLPPLPNPLSLVEGALHLFGANGVDLPDIPTSIALANAPFRFASALLIALLWAAAFGALIHLLVFRPLRNAPPLAKLVAAIGLFVVMISAINIRFGGDAQPVAPVLSKGAIRLKAPGRPLVLPSAQLQIAVIVVLMAVVLWFVYGRTRFGLATRAAAENEKGAVLLGISPDKLALANWMLSTVVAGLIGILAAPLTTLDPIGVPLLIVPALGAALAGGFRSFGVTVGAGLGIGALQSLATYVGAQSWFPSATLPPAGVAKTVPFLVIVVVLALRGRSLPQRGTLVPARPPSAPALRRPAVSIGVSSAAVLVLLLVVGFTWRQAIINSLVATVVCLSLVIVTGLVGQISLAQMTIAGTAGFALSKLFASWPFPLGPLAAALVATAVGVLVAQPALRVRGVNLAVVTFAAAAAIEELVFRNPRLASGGGAVTVKPPTLFGFDVGPSNTGLRVFGFKGDGQNPNVWFGVLCLVVTVLMVVLVANLRRSPLGRRMLAVRANERAAAAAGVSVARTKMLAFGLAAFVAGVGGVLSGYRFGSVTPLYFGALASLVIAAIAYLGGIASVGGAVAAGLLAAGGVSELVVTDVLHLAPQFGNLAAGVGLIVVTVLNPSGLAGGLRRLWPAPVVVEGADDAG